MECPDCECISQLAFMCRVYAETWTVYSSKGMWWLGSPVPMCIMPWPYFLTFMIRCRPTWYRQMPKERLGDICCWAHWERLFCLKLWLKINCLQYTHSPSCCSISETEAEFNHFILWSEGLYGLICTHHRFQILPSTKNWNSVFNKKLPVSLSWNMF